jgi:hypothetical protein
MTSRVEGKYPVQAPKSEEKSGEGTLVGRSVKKGLDAGFYCVAVPLGYGAKVLSLTGSAANQLTFRPVVSGLSSVGWLGGNALYYAGKVMEVTGKFFQKGIARRVGAEASHYTEEYFRKAAGVRGRVGSVVSIAASYVPYISGPLVTIERGEKAAEEELSKASSGILSRVWKLGTVLMPSIGAALEYAGKATSFVSKKFANLTYLGMTEPSKLNQVFQNFRDRMDSYAFTLLEAREPPRPVISLCSEGDFKQFLKLGKPARKKIFQAVVSSSWLRISEAEKEGFAAALRSKGVRRSLEDKEALRVMYSAYLCLGDMQKAREALQVGEVQFREFLGLPASEQDKMVFMTLSSPTWDVAGKDREKFEGALKRIRDAIDHASPPVEEDVKEIRVLLGMYKELSKEYLSRALSSVDFEQKLIALDPILARIRIMNIVRERASDLDPAERRTLAKFRKVQKIDDWLTLDESDQKALERLMFYHFNRLPLEDQRALYDLLPNEIWELREGFRVELFEEGQKLLLEHNIHEFDGKNPKEFMQDIDNIRRFTDVLNASLRMAKKIHLHQLVTPPPAVIAFTRSQLKEEIARVKAMLESGEIIAEEESKGVSRYLMMLEATLESKEAFIPIEEFKTEVSKEDVLAKKVPTPIDIKALQSRVGNEVVTTGIFYTPARYLGYAEEMGGSLAGVLIEKLAQGVGLASNPLMIQLMFGALSFGITFFTPEEYLIPALKSLGIEGQVRKMETGAAKIFPYLLHLSGPFERLLLKGVTSTEAWMTALSRAMKIVGDPASAPEQIRKVAEELEAASKGVCEAAAKLGGENAEVVEDVRKVTNILLQQCAVGGMKGLVEEAEKKLPSVSPTAIRAGEVIRKALREKGVVEVDKGILASLKRLWFGGPSGVEGVDPGVIAQVEELGEKLTLLEQAGQASARAESLKKMLEFVPGARRAVSGSLAQRGASGYLSIVRPLLEVTKKGLELEQGLLALSSEAVIQHLKWVGLARETERYASTGGDMLLEQAEKIVGKEGWLSSIARSASYVIPIASSIAFGTGGFILTPILLTFAANDLLPGAAAYLAPRARPMWNYLGAVSRRGAKAAALQSAKLTEAIGYYLQKSLNSGRYVDEKRILNFRNVLSQKEKEFIFNAVRTSFKTPAQRGEELDAMWIKYRKRELSPLEEEAMITTLLLGFEDLTAEDLLAIDPFYFSMLAPYVQERVVHVVEKYNPLAPQEKVAPNYIEILINRYKGLPRAQQEEINLIQPWEYNTLSEEQQRELRFLIVHSKAYQEQLRQEKGGEEAELRIGDLLMHFEHEPKGEELAEFLTKYQNLVPADLASITPQQLQGAGEAKILHALSILEKYHAPWVRELAERDGRDITLLRKIIQSPQPRSTAMDAQEKRLVEALASLCHQLPEYQQQYLLDLTEVEVEEMARDGEKLDACFRHLVTYIVDPDSKADLTAMVGTYKTRGPDARKLVALFNSLSPAEKAAFRQKQQPKADAIERVRDMLIQTNVEILELTEAAEKTKYSLESLVTASELLRLKSKGALIAQDEARIQRYELNASAFSSKLEVIEKRIGELVEMHSRLEESLSRFGVQDIPPLPLEEVDKHNPQRKSELLALSSIADFEVSSAVRLVKQQTTLGELEKVLQMQFEQKEYRRSEGNASIAEMEAQKVELYKEVSKVKGIAKAKAKASLTLLEKRIGFSQYYLKIYDEKFSLVEKAIEEKRAELMGKG